MFRRIVVLLGLVFFLLADRPVCARLLVRVWGPKEKSPALFGRFYRDGH